MERCYQTAGGCTLGLRFGTLEIPWPPWAPTCLLRQCSANSWWVPKVFVRITRSNTYTCEITVHYYKTYMWGFHLLMWQGQGKYRTGCGDWEQWIRSFLCFTCKVPTSALHIVKQRRHLDSKGDVLPGHIKKVISATCLLKMDTEKHLTQNNIRLCIWSLMGHFAATVPLNSLWKGIY